MPVNVALIVQPSIDFNTLLGITHEAVGRNIAAVADASPRSLSPSEKYVVSLASMKNPTPDVTESLLSHVSFGILIIIDSHNVLDVLDVASGMSFVSVETEIPDCQLIVLTGTLAQWRDAIASGTSSSAATHVRTCYSKILLLFDQLGLSSIWKDYSWTSDRTGYYLEHKHV
jgi:hypothetical protein